MARAGIYKNDVLRARQAVIARGDKPSIRAIRIALGNTGSDSTIHKYLKEIEENEEGGAPTPSANSLNEAISGFIAGLALELENQSKINVEAAIAAFRLRDAEVSEQLASVQMKKSELESALISEQERFTDEKTAHSVTSQLLNAEALLRTGFEAQVSELRARDAERDAQLRAAEKNAAHSREALEHYRAAVKQQRDQEKRGSEQLLAEVRLQVRALTAQNQELVAALKHLEAKSAQDALTAEMERRALQEEQRGRRHAEKGFSRVEAERISLLERLAKESAKIALSAEQNDTLKRQNSDLTKESKELKSALSSLSAKMSAQEDLLEPLKKLIETGGFAMQFRRRKRQVQF